MEKERKLFIKALIIPLIVLILISAVSTGVIFYLSLPKNLEGCLPKKISTDQKENLRLIRTVSGYEALMLAKSSHRGEIKYVKDMAIGFYTNNTSIWLTEYPTSKISQKETERMAKAMKRFGGGFENLKTRKISGKKVYTTFPEDKAQYFFSNGKIMVYIVPEELKEKEIEKLIKKLNTKIFLYSFPLKF